MVLAATLAAGPAFAQGRMGRDFGALRTGDCAAVSRFAWSYAGREGYSNYAGQIAARQATCRDAQARAATTRAEAQRTARAAAPEPAPRAAPTRTAQARPAQTRQAAPVRTTQARPQPSRAQPVRTAAVRPAPAPARTPAPRPAPVRTAAVQPSAPARTAMPSPARATPARSVIAANAATATLASATTPLQLPRPYTPRNPFTTTPAAVNPPAIAPETAVAQLPAPPPPAPAPQPAWLSTGEVLAFLRTNLFCHGYDARTGDCSAIEELAAEGDGPIVLKRTVLMDVASRRHDPNVLDAVGFAPETARMEAPVSLYATGPDLCSARETARNDAGQLRVVLAGSEDGAAPLDGYALDRLRRTAEREAAERDGNIVCRRYRWVERGRTLREDYVIDGRAVSGATIRLIARSSRSVRLALLPLAIR